MANNRLYLVDKKSKKGIMIAKSFGVEWKVWPERLQYKLSALFMGNDDVPDVGDNETSFKVITEYDDNFEDYEIIQ